MIRPARALPVPTSTPRRTERVGTAGTAAAAISREAEARPPEKEEEPRSEKAEALPPRWR